MEGYIGLFRCLLENPIWKMSTPEQKTILITLLLMVNHKEVEWEWQGEKFKAQPGQRVTSLENIAKACGKGISIQNVRSALKRFEKLGFLTNQSTKTGRLITIVNWHLYQVEKMKTNKASNKAPTKRQQRSNKELTPNNNDNNDKHLLYIDEFERIWRLYPNKKGKQKAREGFLKIKARYPFEEIERAVERYASEVEGKESQFIQHGSRFFNGTYEDYLDINYNPSYIKPKPKSIYQVDSS